MESYKQNSRNKEKGQLTQNKKISALEQQLQQRANQKHWDNQIKIDPIEQERKYPFITQEKLEIDETGKQFKILPFITYDSLSAFLNNVDDIQITKKKKYEEILKIAGRIGMETEEDMIEHDDLLLDGLRAPPGWFRIQYIKGNQKFFWNQQTKERLKANPDMENLRQEFFERKNNSCFILDLITIQDLERFWLNLEADTPIKSVQINEESCGPNSLPESNPLAIIKQCALDIGMTNIKQMKKPIYQQILFKALNPQNDWSRVIFNNQGTVGYFNPKIQERSDDHPYITKLKYEFLAAKEQHNYEFLKEVTDKELQKYFETPENQYSTFSKREQQVQKDIEQAAKLLGMENKDDIQNYQNILLKYLRPGDGWKRIQYDDDNKICFMNTLNKMTSDFHPDLNKLRKELADVRAALIRKQEKVGEDRILNLYAGEFKKETIHNEIKIGEKGKIIVKKNADPKIWKVAVLQPELLKDTVRRFSYFIKKMHNEKKMYIGYKEPKSYSIHHIHQQLFSLTFIIRICQNEVMEEEEQYILNLQNPGEGVYMISAEGKEIYQNISNSDEDKFKKVKEEAMQKYKQYPEQRFTFKQGDEIIVEVDLTEKIVIYLNKRTNISYTQKIRRLEEEFSMAAAMINPLDEIIIEPRSNFPIHFCLTWEHPEVDLDMHLTCACGKEISFKFKKCNGCLTYLDKDHITGKNPIEHIFIRNLPKNGQVWKYGVFYYEDHSENKVAKNIDYSVAVISVDENENYRTLQRRDGFLQHEGDETSFEFLYSSEKITNSKNQKNQKQVLQIKK